MLHVEQNGTALSLKDRSLSDPFPLERFVQAQAAVWDNVCRELAAGRKQSHWMWFVFPQIAGLGHSAIAQMYAIASLDEARAYLAHPVLGPRMREATQLVLNVEGKNAHAIFGSPDDLKFRSSMTLFDAASPNDLFADTLQKYFDGEGDPFTLAALKP
ncbi:MAG TPA: DUF1810 domain-containing protein [Rhizomicrobium sp.]|nr:DUF1810 domain-containing protein [Rhizomicrobium sp.]